jgi:glycosyltransferase involved in cell wall biosynthesis
MLTFGKFKSYLGHRAREVAAHVQRWRQPRGLPRVVILPCGTRALGSSNLRAWAVGRELRGLGWRVTVVPPQCELSQRRRIIRWERPDVILLQKGRHPLNWPHYYEGTPIVFDLDDADFLDPGQAEQVRACCCGSEAVIAGSRFTADWCGRHNANTTVIWTGSPLPARRAGLRPSRRRPVLAWAHSDALLSPRDAEAAREIVLGVAARTEVEFWMYGVKDPAEASRFVEPVRRAGAPVRLLPYMSYGAFLESLTDVAVGLNPQSLSTPYNQGKSFGKVLAYLSSEVATVSSNVLENPRFFRHGVNGMLADTVAEFVEHVTLLLQDRALRERVAEQGYRDFEQDLSSGAAGRQVDRLLRAAIGRR